MPCTLVTISLSLRTCVQVGQKVEAISTLTQKLRLRVILPEYQDYGITFFRFAFFGNCFALLRDLYL